MTDLTAHKIKKNKTIYTALLIIVLSIFGVTGCSNSLSDTKVVLTTGLKSDEVFRIESISCMRPEIMVYITNMQNRYENVYGSDIWETRVDGESLSTNVKDNALAKMAQVKTMNLMARDRGISLDAQEEKQVIQAGDKYYDSLNSAEIEAMGIDREIIYSLYREYMTAGKVYEEIIKDINPEVSDDEARNISVEYILIKNYTQDGTGKKTAMSANDAEAAYARAREAHTRAVEGDEFDTLISEYNEDESSTASFGKADIGDIVLRNTLFDMASGEISDVLETSEGYVIYKILSTFDLEETDANKKAIVERQRAEVFGAEYDTYVQTLTRKLNDTLWNEIVFLEGDEIITSDFFEVAETYLNQHSQLLSANFMLTFIRTGIKLSISKRIYTKDRR